MEHFSNHSAFCWVVLFVGGDYAVLPKNCPERLQAETDNGRIYVHIDERITEYEKEKWKIWNKMRATDPEYALAMKNADTAKV